MMQLVMMPVIADVLLTAAQSLFMVLPVTGLYLAREGKPTPVHAPKVIMMSAAITAFTLLVIMFSLSTKSLGPPKYQH